MFACAGLLNEFFQIYCTELQRAVWSFVTILEKPLQHRPPHCLWNNSTVDWYLVFLFHQERKYSADVAKIYSIHITNVLGGVASQCRHCALSSTKAGSACVPCPPGHYMVNGTGVCKSCLPNTFVRADQPVGEAACVQCGPNTETNKVKRNPFHWKSLNTD